MITSSTSSKNVEFPKPAQRFFARLPKPGRPAAFALGLTGFSWDRLT
ncbi:MAG: hypothetical protein PSV13_04390 [Lacunisphaera sp.]|nr:hypothetical protein [Lacunisphaera sp.]